jgi:hypothetical protein
MAFKQKLSKIRFYKDEQKRYDWATKYIKSELKTDRHILACLGSAGITFTSDVNRFKEYLKSKGELKLAKIIENMRSRTKKEMREL